MENSVNCPAARAASFSDPAPLVTNARDERPSLDLMKHLDRRHDVRLVRIDEGQTKSPPRMAPRGLSIILAMMTLYT